jgi:Protein of unknown function (DUF2637)
MIEKLSKLWTDSIAYLALFAGAGLSIAGNVADTLRTRGPATDTLDLVIAVAFPALVILMVEVFVNARWIGLPRPMQVLRWAGCLSIGLIAMRVSWVHLNDLMASRGQKVDVAVLGPLAIDLLAIMATALILAGRGHRATVQVSAVLEDSPAEVATVQQDAALVDMSSADIWSRLDTELFSGQDAPVSSPPAPLPPKTNTVKRGTVPPMAADQIQLWKQALAEGVQDALKAGELDTMLAELHGVNIRTARRWRYAVTAQ